MAKMVAGAKKLKIGRALRSAARLPARVASGKGSGRDVFAPMPGEPPIVLLKVQVLACAELPGKDRNGTSDPYVRLRTNLLTKLPTRADYIPMTSSLHFLCVRTMFVQIRRRLAIEQAPPDASPEEDPQPCLSRQRRDLRVSHLPQSRRSAWRRGARRVG